MLDRHVFKMLAFRFKALKLGNQNLLRAVICIVSLSRRHCRRTLQRNCHGTPYNRALHLKWSTYSYGILLTRFKTRFFKQQNATKGVLFFLKKLLDVQRERNCVFVLPC